MYFNICKFDNINFFFQVNKYATDMIYIFHIKFPSIIFLDCFSA